MFNSYRPGQLLDFYTNKLDFQIIEDTRLSIEKRWVLIAPKGATECSILLAKAADKQQLECVGNQVGGRVGFFLFTDDFWGDYNRMREMEINFLRPPTSHDYGIVAVFADLYGNRWDLVEPNDKNKGWIVGTVGIDEGH